MLCCYFAFLCSEKVSQSALQRLDVFPSSQIPSGSLTGNLILAPQGALMRIKCTLNLSLCNYSAVMLQICRLSSAPQQHFQILPKEENTVFLMKRVKWLILALVVFIHCFHKYAVIVVVAQSPKTKYFHVKQNQYQGNKEQWSSIQHVSTFLCFNIKVHRLSC